MRPSINEWHTFTRIWVTNVRQLGRDTNYCRLALAMHDSDGGRRDFDYYIGLAIKCKAHFDEMEDARLQRRKAAAELRAWTFAFSGHGWQVEEPGLLIQEPTLVKALNGVEEWGEGMRAYWAAEKAAHLAKKAAQAIQNDVQHILEGTHE